MSVACPPASSCPIFDSKGPLVLKAAAEPIFFLRFCANRILCPRAIAQSPIGGWGEGGHKGGASADRGWGGSGKQAQRAPAPGVCNRPQACVPFGGQQLLPPIVAAGGVWRAGPPVGFRVDGSCGFLRLCPWARPGRIASSHGAAALRHPTHRLRQRCPAPTPVAV